jgi:exodeoxyribonuclease V alpha subunit
VHGRDLELLYTKGWLSPLDYHFGGLIARLSGNDDPELFLAAALVSKHTGQGHVCFDLSSVAGRPVFEEERAEVPLTLTFPRLHPWRDKIEQSPAVGKPGEFRPLILDGKHRLYLYRYWEYENRLADCIKERSRAAVDSIDRPLLMDGLARHFPETDPGGRTDWQKVAALTSVVRKLCIISGGPGTGKTTTVAKILALLLEQAKGGRLWIALAAPTGKAATRLEEAIAEAVSRLDCPDAVKEAIPRDASTLHRLLGAVSSSPYFRRNAENPLTQDVVVVDEASMVDLALMAKLASALPDHARLILLGDKDQLASVEAGAVLGDMCNTGSLHPYSGSAEELLLGAEAHSRGGEESGGNGQPAIATCIVELRKSYRFGEESGIGALSRAIKKGDGAGALELLRNGRFQDIEWKELPHPEALVRALRSPVLEGFRQFFDSSGTSEMWDGFGRFRILCALRRGPFGAAALNTLVEQVLREQRIIQPGQWYHRRPIMVTRNDYNLRLFNGDIGFVLDHWEDVENGTGGARTHGARDDATDAAGDDGVRDDEGDTGTKDGVEDDARDGADGRRRVESGAGCEVRMRAVFPVSNGPPRAFPPSRLPEHETVYATTVHKSQGSEFDEVLLILSDRESPALTRELLYTGITRARKRLVVWGREDVFRAAASKRIQRSSGLRDAIWGASGLEQDAG